MCNGQTIQDVKLLFVTSAEPVLPPDGWCKLTIYSHISRAPCLDVKNVENLTPAYKSRQKNNMPRLWPFVYIIKFKSVHTSIVSCIAILYKQ